MKINLDSQSDDIRIEIIPLIDVIFCILTFFILAALQFTRQQAISVDLPKATTSTTPSQTRELLIVSINPFNQIYVENELVLPEELEEKLRQYHQQKPEGMMVLYASKTAFYNDVVQVLDKMRLVGGDRVALATFPDPSGQDSNPALPTPGTAGTPGTTPNLPGVNPPSGVNPVTPNPGTTTNPLNPYSNPYLTPNPGQSTVPGLPGQTPGTPGINPPIPGTGTLTPNVPSPSGVPEPPGTTATPGTSSTPKTTPSR